MENPLENREKINYQTVNLAGSKEVSILCYSRMNRDEKSYANIKEKLMQQGGDALKISDEMGKRPVSS